MNTIIIIGIIIFIILCIYTVWEDKTRQIRKGKEGERIVKSILKKLPSDKYLSLYDVLIETPIGTSQIDHIVISNYGIFVIETKNYYGKIVGAEDDEYWEQITPKETRKFYNPIKQNEGHIKALNNILHLDRNHYRSAVAFSPDSELFLDVTSHIIRTYEVNEFVKFYRARVFDDEKKNTLYNKIKKANISSRRNNKTHIKNVKETEFRKENEDTGITCPNCGGKLLLKRGKYGYFYGCSNYPSCTYTKKISGSSWIARVIFMSVKIIS